MSQICEILFQSRDINTFLSFVVSFLVDMFNQNTPFLTKKTSAGKSETLFNKEAIAN